MEVPAVCACASAVIVTWGIASLEVGGGVVPAGGGKGGKDGAAELGAVGGGVRGGGWGKRGWAVGRGSKPGLSAAWLGEDVIGQWLGLALLEHLADEEGWGLGRSGGWVDTVWLRLSF